MAIGPHQQALADAVRPGDRANVAAGEDAWERGARALKDVAGNIDRICARLSTESPGGQPAFSGQTASAAMTAFQESAKAMRERAGELIDARDALTVARVALREATRESRKMGHGMDPGQEPRSTTSNPTQAEIDEHKAWKKRDNAAKADYVQRENDSREALADLRAAYVRASASMKKIHGQTPVPPPGRTPGDGDDGNDGGRPPVGNTPVKPPHTQDPDPTDETKPPVQVLPPPTQEDPPVTTEEPPPDRDPDPGSDDDDEGTRQWNPSEPPSEPRPPGPGTSVPAGGGSGGSGGSGGVGSVAAGAGLGSVGVAAGGMAAGIGGRPAAVPTGSVGAGSAGARGALGGSTRAGGSSVLGKGGSPGVAGQSTSRGGAKAGAGGARGGARGAAGASGSRGGRGGRAGAAGAAGGRRGGQGRDRRDGDRDLFDDGKDWLDDEEQGPGVLD